MLQGIVVFLGPSLAESEARLILDASYRPPAARGDVLRAAREGAEIICLIDGVFFQECSVAHREVLEAVREGARVIGASSMGALRAAELDGLGMEGVGEIYRMYRDGEIVSDDEVALIFDPETFVQLSEPLVNIRCTLSRAVNESVIDPVSASILLDCARSLYFPERTYESVLERAREKLDPSVSEAFSRFIDRGRVDQKREDAILALRRVRAIAGI
ncbi:MAG: TfuA-related McrA-glycine thioamidation protein [Methanoregulaceae archaeon]|nr:TfuA-related McrA-glycine thioamidation protein [Methanoregulaceae archaeon]